jgi:2-C-methyl-D-erythritol 2,4-cyclodiphosphate synthase
MDSSAMDGEVPFRVGQSVDIHARTDDPDRLLVLGGVVFSDAPGLAGHSDADVVAHACIDALLGAAGLGDIGRLFPDTDPRHAGADSRVLLREAFAAVRSAGYEVVNVDATVICRAPKILPHVPAMAANIAAHLANAASPVNKQGKTTEKLGFTGRGEGIAAQVVALLVSSADER